MSVTSLIFWDLRILPWALVENEIKKKVHKALLEEISSCYPGPSCTGSCDQILLEFRTGVAEGQYCLSKRAGLLPLFNQRKP